MLAVAIIESGTWPTRLRSRPGGRRTRVPAGSEAGASRAVLGHDAVNPSNGNLDSGWARQVMAELGTLQDRLSASFTCAA